MSRESQPEGLTNPWLSIPLADYEGHMGLPSIAQAQLLSDLLAEALAECRPESVAVLGCAGGNGLDRIDPQTTRRVVGVDLNPEYLRTAHARFHDRFPGLELHAGDVQNCSFGFDPVDLVFAALLFEYVDPNETLARIREMLSPEGRLATVVQLAGEQIPEVSPSPFTRLGELQPIMRLVPPESLHDHARANGYRRIDTRRVEAGGGKQFQVQTFCLEAAGAGFNPPVQDLVE